MRPNASTFIPIGLHHRLENPDNLPLELIAVRSGSPIFADNIVRFQAATADAPMHPAPTAVRSLSRFLRKAQGMSRAYGVEIHTVRVYNFVPCTCIEVKSLVVVPIVVGEVR